VQLLFEDLFVVANELPSLHGDFESAACPSHRSRTGLVVLLFPIAESVAMPLTLEELQGIQADAMADDLEIDFDKMSLWTAEQATACKRAAAD
jgi:hypothetical protein